MCGLILTVWSLAFVSAMVPAFLGLGYFGKIRRWERLEERSEELGEWPFPSWLSAKRLRAWSLRHRWALMAVFVASIGVLFITFGILEVRGCRS